MREFKGIEQAIKYAERKSSSSVFAEAHGRDYLAGYDQALKDSFAPEMLEMLEKIIKTFEGEGLENYQEIRLKQAKEIIKKATEL